MNARWIPAALATFLLALSACTETSAPPRPAGVGIRIVPVQIDDGRTYSVGRVQLRALDATDNVTAAQIFAIDRATGVIDVDFDVPAGPGLRILVEPLGSGILPNGGKTESGVALQGMSLPFNLEPNGFAEVEVPLFPFIPNNLRLEGSIETFLAWDAMTPALFHTVRVFESIISTGAELDDTAEREVVIPAGSRVPLLALRRSGWEPTAFQVRSENIYAFSAYSDTLFLGRGFKGGGEAGTR